MELVLDTLEVGGVARVGELVEHRDAGAALGQPAHEVRADEPRPAGDEHAHRGSLAALSTASGANPASFGVVRPKRSTVITLESIPISRFEAAARLVRPLPPRRHSRRLRHRRCRVPRASRLQRRRCGRRRAARELVTSVTRPRGTPRGPRASAAARARPSRSAAPSMAGRGARAPNSAVVIRRTRQSRPASSKIASAKSAQVQSPSAATCQTPYGGAAVDELARRRGQVPDVGRAAPLVVDDRDLVALGAEPQHRADEVVPGRAEEPRAAHDPRRLARRGLAVELRPPVGGQRVRAVGLDVRRALAAVEDVVGRVGDERRAELGGVAVPPTLTSAAPCGSSSAPSTSVQAAACSTRSGAPSARRRQLDVPVGARQRRDVVVGEGLGEGARRAARRRP